MSIESINSHSRIKTAIFKASYVELNEHLNLSKKTKIIYLKMGIVVFSRIEILFNISISKFFRDRSFVNVASRMTGKAYFGSILKL